MKKDYLWHALLCIIACMFELSAQVGIGTDAPRGALDINSPTTNTSGLVLPTNSGTSAMVNPQGGGTPVAGTIMYDSSVDCIRLYKQTAEWSGCLLEESVLGESEGTLGGENGSCAPIQVNGSYAVNTDLTSSNTVIVQVNVTTPGTYTVTTDEVNGYSYSGTGTFGSIGTHTVILEGTGTPLASGTDSFTVSYDGGTCTFDVNVASSVSTGSLSGAPSDCSGSSVQGTYTRGQALVSGNTVTVTVNVTAVGSYTITTDAVNGYSFSASGTFGSTGTQTVVMSNNGGTPTASGTDTFTITYNGATTGTCTVDVTVVSPAATVSSLNCSSAVVTGTLTENEAASGVSISIPYTGGNGGTYSAISVASTGVTGLTASASSGNVASGAGNLVLNVTGTGTSSGTASFLISFGGQTCTVEIPVTPSIGTFSDPAKSCLAIYNDYQTAGQTVEDGEFYIEGSGTDAVKTYCDMTNGGYTLIQSFSEFQVFGTANNGPDRAFLLNQQNLNVNANRNYSTATGATGTVNYENYLLPLDVRQNVRNSTTGNLYRVRIVEDEANVANNDDTWASNNYAVFNFSPSGTYDFIGNGGWAINTPIINGKMFGKTYTSLGAASGGNYVSFDGQSWAEAYTYNAGGARVISHQNSPPNYAFSYTNSDTSTTSTNLTALDDVWGMYGDSTFNHHIGKCDADDYQGATECAGTNRQTHSFNSGKGRFVQWFVK